MLFVSCCRAAVKLAKVPWTGQLDQERFRCIIGFGPCLNALPTKKAMMGLTHPNVVKLLAEVRKDDGVIMELCTALEALLVQHV